ncbi:hypothetical protein [Streptomyces justiciae]|uniref:hypothetical protein n=1 Tax=Streptomyces justiciae TaxID=2780140 RepID=UPI002117AB2F|nr:hypothetical protein [Streptomyces justiciae]MCW8378701.1 hypothetical protein [Streptomyces justiciae]
MIAPDAPAISSPHQNLSALRSALVPGLVGGLLGALVSAVLNYALIGMPDDMADNLLHQGVSGLITGIVGGFLGLRIHLRGKRSSGGRHAARRRAASPGLDAQEASKAPRSGVGPW